MMLQQTQVHTDILKRQKIDESGPGTILADFEALLKFVGTVGIKTGGKNFRIPLAALNDLDERMTHPLRPKLERPQQLSFPHLNGLYLLFRSTGLGVASGQGTTGRLSVHPKALEQWKSLNPVEKYFTLFHAFLAGDWSLISSDRSSGFGLMQDIAWSYERAVGLRTAKLKPGKSFTEYFFGWKDQTVSALLELFGILEISRGEPRAGENWRITAIQPTEFGTALLARLREYHIRRLLDDRDDDLDDDDETAENETEWLGSIFREEFPECLNTLRLNDNEFVEGIWQFKLSWGKVWRRILIPAEATTEDLVDGILRELEFDKDHLYQFGLRDRSGRIITICHPALDSADFICDEFPIGSLPLDPGQSMTLVYDFGDNWKFQIKFEKLLPPDNTVTEFQVTERKGDAPSQYDFDGDGW